MKSKPALKPHQTSLIWAAVATLAGFLVPGLQKVLLPLEYLNTHLHELSHALMAIATGGQVEEILVHANGSGETPVRGGSLLLVASAGYMGASVIGALMIYFGRNERGATRTLWALVAALTFSVLVWVRQDPVGMLTGLGCVVVLGLVALTVKGRAQTFCVQFLGLQQCLNALKAVFVLVGLSTSTDVHSDATILQQATQIPSVAWALGWTAFSLALVGWSLRKSWSTTGRAG